MRVVRWFNIASAQNILSFIQAVITEVRRSLEKFIILAHAVTLDWQWWAKSDRDSIQSLFESQRRFDSNIVRFDSSTMRFDTDSIQILTIRFKRHAILTEISKSWLKLN